MEDKIVDQEYIGFIENIITLANEDTIGMLGHELWRLQNSLHSSVFIFPYLSSERIDNNTKDIRLAKFHTNYNDVILLIDTIINTARRKSGDHQIIVILEDEGGFLKDEVLELTLKGISGNYALYIFVIFYIIRRRYYAQADKAMEGLQYNKDFEAIIRDLQPIKQAMSDTGDFFKKWAYRYNKPIPPTDHLPP